MQSVQEHGTENVHENDGGDEVVDGEEVGPDDAAHAVRTQLRVPAGARARVRGLGHCAEHRTRVLSRRCNRLAHVGSRSARLGLCFTRGVCKHFDEH